MPSETKHTPGPWKRQTGINAAFPELPEIIQIVHERDDGGARYVCDLMPHVYETTPDGLREELDANARLIAAAPEMLEALEQILDALEHEDSGKEPDEATDPMLGIARAALRKARGEGE